MQPTSGPYGPLVAYRLHAATRSLLCWHQCQWCGTVGADVNKRKRGCPMSPKARHFSVAEGEDGATVHVHADPDLLAFVRNERATVALVTDLARILTEELEKHSGGERSRLNDQNFVGALRLAHEIYNKTEEDLETQ